MEGEWAEAVSIPQWKGERLRDRLHGMDYKSLVELKPEEILLD